jgi:hypothetical protein
MGMAIVQALNLLLSYGPQVASFFSELFNRASSQGRTQLTPEEEQEILAFEGAAKSDYDWMIQDARNRLGLPTPPGDAALPPASDE